MDRFIGNPALTATLNFLFRTRCSDVYCGFRGFSRAAYDRIRPVRPGMEFDRELAINAGLAGLKISKIPIEWDRGHHFHIALHFGHVNEQVGRMRVGSRGASAPVFAGLEPG